MIALRGGAQGTGCEIEVEEGEERSGYLGRPQEWSSVHAASLEHQVEPQGLGQDIDWATVMRLARVRRAKCQAGPAPLHQPIRLPLSLGFTRSSISD